jgi:hypothetical protein
MNLQGQAYAIRYVQEFTRHVNIRITQIYIGIN